MAVMPSFTFVSTANAFVLRGATPVFVDVRPDTLTIDPAQVDPGLDLSALEDTRALLLVGDQDVVAGSAGADAIARQLTSLPDDLRTTRVVRTSDELVADHEAPTYVDSPAVRKTFWEPLDELVDESRS